MQDPNLYSQPSAASTAANTAFLAVGLGIVIALLVFGLMMIIGGWKTFKKAGQPGWAILVPFYNVYVWLKIVGRPAWWLLLFFVPVVSLIISWIISVDLAKAFGKSTVFGVILLWLFPGIGFLILGFGPAQYTGPDGGSGGVAPAAPYSPGLPPADPVPPANPQPPASTPPTTPPANPPTPTA